jgi:hypothetical protein
MTWFEAESTHVPLTHIFIASLLFDRFIKPRITLNTAEIAERFSPENDQRFPVFSELNAHPYAPTAPSHWWDENYSCVDLPVRNLLFPG